MNRRKLNAQGLFQSYKKPWKLKTEKNSFKSLPLNKVKKNTIKEEKYIYCKLLLIYLLIFTNFIFHYKVFSIYKLTKPQ